MLVAFDLSSPSQVGETRLYGMYPMACLGVQNKIEKVKFNCLEREPIDNGLLCKVDGVVGNAGSRKPLKTRRKDNGKEARKIELIN